MLKKDLKHILGITTASVFYVSFLIGLMEKEIIFLIMSYINIILGPILMIYTFFKSLDYRNEKFYFVFFLLGVIGFFGFFIENKEINYITNLSWVVAFVYFPIMKYVEFTIEWFKPVNEKELHWYKKMLIRKKLKKKYKEDMYIEVLSNSYKEAKIRFMKPKENPKFVMLEWEVKFGYIGMKIKKEEWIAEKKEDAD